MPRISLVGDHGGVEDYATLRLWWVAEAGNDYGSEIEAVIMGDVGAGITTEINGSAFYGASIYGSVEYNGANEDDIAFTTGLSITAPDVTLRDLKSYGVLTLSGNNSHIYRCRVLGGVSLHNTALGKLVRNCVISKATNYVITYGSGKQGTVENCVVFGTSGIGIIVGGGGGQNLKNNFAFNNGGNDYKGTADTFIDNASEDATGSVGLTGYTSAELVDFAGGDYRTKSTSDLATGGSGGSFIGAFLEIPTSTGTEQPITLATTEQITQSETVSVMGIGFANAITSQLITESQLVNILGIGAINAIVSEQKSQSQLVSVTEINQLNAITSEQKTQSTLINISEINHVSAIVCEQLTQSVLVVVTANGAQSVNVIITEQKTQSELVSVDEVASVNVITSEQLTQSNLVNIDESSGALISVVIAEQKTQSELVSISAIANINPVICEQLTQSNIQQISVDITIDAIICEQLTQSQLITIIQSNIADALNIDIDQITIEMLTPKYTIEMLTPKYTIEHIH